MRRGGLVLWLVAGTIAAAAGPPTAQDTSPWPAQLASIVEREMSDKGIPAFAIGVVDRTRDSVELVRGRRAVGSASAVAPDTLFRTGSVGKTITDLAVMAAADARKVDLRADVRTYLPDFAPENPFGVPITLHELMTHTAGLVREPPEGSYYDATSPSLADTVRSLNRTSLVWAPHGRTKYSNAGVAVAGRVLEAVYGQPFASLAGSLVFRPAGMRTASVGLSPSVRATVARGIMWNPVTGDEWQAPMFNLGMSPAGDLYASLRDMEALITTLLRRDGRIVSAKTLERMWVPQREPTPQTWQLDVGIGFSLNGKFLQQYRMARNGGAVYGYATELAVLPEEGLGVYAVAAREIANDTVQAIAQWALEAALNARQGQPAPAYRMSARPAADLPERLARCVTTDVDPSFAPYVGRYGWEHSPLLLCQLEGRLHALVEGYSLYPLTDQGKGVFGFPSYALFGQEQLWFVRTAGQVTAAVIGHGPDGVRFPRMGER